MSHPLADHAYPADEPVADDLPEITVHREPFAVGSDGARYLRCEGCGGEVITGADGIVHDDGCPRRREWR